MIEPVFKHFSRGKLLLTGEYFVLDGARALAVPTIPGQHFSVSEPTASSDLIWRSLNHLEQCWFQASFELRDGTVRPKNATDRDIAARTAQLLQTSLEMQPQLRERWACRVETRLEFDRSWGLGSSSTLINSLAQWLDIDPYTLLERTFGGSGYDIACAKADGPLIYRNDTEERTVPVTLPWDFTDRLWLVYLGKKQNSRDAIRHYRKLTLHDKTSAMDRIGLFTDAFAGCTSLEEFIARMKEHERFVSAAIQMPCVQEERFPKFEGAIKSLGAWGGDFALAATDWPGETVQTFFRNKGLTTVLPWKKLIYA